MQRCYYCSKNVSRRVWFSNIDGERVSLPFCEMHAREVESLQKIKPIDSHKDYPFYRRNTPAAGGAVTNSMLVRNDYLEPAKTVNPKVDVADLIRLHGLGVIWLVEEGELAST